MIYLQSGRKKYVKTPRKTVKMPSVNINLSNGISIFVHYVLERFIHTTSNPISHP